MRGRGWIKALRQDEARQVRARIAELERDLIAPHLKDAIDVSKPDMNFAMRSFAWRVSRNASPKYRRNIGVSGSFAALNACSRTSSLRCDQIDPQKMRNGRGPARARMAGPSTKFSRL